MKKILNSKITRLFAVTGLLLGLFGAGFPLPVHAETASIALVPNSTSVTVGTTFEVTVNATSDSPVSTVQSKITYNATAVSMQSIDYAGSPFTTSLPDSATNNGSIFISRFTVPPFPTNNIFIAKITFKALKDTGDAGLASDKNASGLYSGNTSQNILTSSGSATVNLVGIPLTNNGGGGSGGGTSNPKTAPTTTTPSTITPSTTTPTTTNTNPVTYPAGSITGTPDENTAVIAKKKGVDGLSIAQYRKQATIGVTVAIFLGGVAYLGFYLNKRNMLPFRRSGIVETPGSVVFDGSTHHRPSPHAPVEPPSNIIKPTEHHDDLSA